MIVFTLGFAQVQKGDADRGQTFFKHIFAPELGYGGETFVAMYTGLEWEAIFSDDAKEFKKEFCQSDKLKEFCDSEKFNKISIHIKAFAQKYALGTGNIPHCGDLNID
jgi:hypothetical protein